MAFRLCCFTYAVLIFCVPFPYGVWGRTWNSIVSIPDHCLFIYTEKGILWKQGKCTVYIIRILNGCEVLIENSVTRVTVRSLVMPNSYPSDGIFNLHRSFIMDSFLAYSSDDNCIGLEYVLFYQFYAKITTFFDQEKFGTAPLLYVDVETLAELT